MGSLFNPERGLWRALSTLVDICGLSLLWLALCLPVVTSGPATTALYYAVVKYVRRQEQGAFAAFFRSFRENLKTGLLAALVCLAAGLILTVCFRVMLWSRATQLGYFMYAAYCVALLLPAGALCWLFPLLARFETGLKALFITAFQMAVAHLPSTLAAVVLTAGAVLVSLLLWWPALFLPALMALVNSLFFERAFLKHSPELAREGREEHKADPDGENIS